MQEISGESIVAIDLDPTLPELIWNKTATPMPRQPKAIAPPPMQLNPISCTNPPSTIILVPFSIAFTMLLWAEK